MDEMRNVRQVYGSSWNTEVVESVTHTHEFVSLTNDLDTRECLEATYVTCPPFQMLMVMFDGTSGQQYECTSDRALLSPQR
jgi:hypothetical protein